MNNTILLQELYDFKERHDFLEKDKEYIELIEKIKNDIRLETASESNDKQRYQAAVKILNDKRMKTRPILQKCVIRNGLQQFTNSYILVQLKKPIPGLEQHDETETEKYPIFDKLIYGSKSNNTFSETKKAIELKTLIKTSNKKAPLCVIENASFKIHIESDLLKIALDLLQFKNNDDVVMFYKESYISPIYIENESGIALIIPMRVEE